MYGISTTSPGQISAREGIVSVFGSVTITVHVFAVPLYTPVIVASPAFFARIKHLLLFPVGIAVAIVGSDVDHTIFDSHPSKSRILFSDRPQS